MFEAFRPPSTCHICQGVLEPHPLYSTSGAQYCPQDGDFFIQHIKGQKSQVIFRPFDEAPEIKPIPKKHPIVIREKSPAVKSEPKSLARRVRWTIEPSEYLKKIRVKPVPLGPGGGYVQDQIKVRCVETGVIFESVRKACAAMQLDKQSMYKHLKGVRPAVSGYTFVKVKSD